MRRLRDGAAPEDRRRRSRPARVVGEARRGVEGHDVSGAAGKRSTAWRISGSPRSSRSKTAATSAASTTSVTRAATSTRPRLHLLHERAAPAAAGPTAAPARQGCRRSGWRRSAPGCGGTPRRAAGASPRPGRSPEATTVPSTTTERTASCRARSLPLSSMAESTPSGAPVADRGAGAPSDVGRHDLGRSHRPGHLQPARHAVDRDHLGTAERRQAGGQQPDDALAEDRDAVPESHLGGQDGVQRDRPDPGEGAGDRVLSRSRPGARPRRPGPRPRCGDPRCRARRRRRQARLARHHVVGDLHHLADLGVAPALDGIAERRRALDEEPALGVPGAGQVGVGAAVGGELGPGGDAGVPGADPHRAGDQWLRLARDQRDLPGSGERHDLGHGSPPDSSTVRWCGGGVSPSRPRRSGRRPAIAR